MPFKSACQKGYSGVARQMADQVRARPKTCIMLDAPLQDGAVQFGTGCDLDGLTRCFGVAWPLLYGFKISDMGTINYPDVSLYGILCPLPILH